ncbi:MAG: DUF4398 domain-containing protein [Burkholderiales bacterium]|nr:DUF4398 domain-containing protein [Burkholderiales bacterium]
MNTSIARYAATSFVVAGAFGLAACSTVPAPTQQMGVAKSAIEQAQHVGAAQYASAELLVATDKMARADTAAHAEKYVQARRLAEEVEVDAQLAQVTATSTKSAAAVHELNKSTQDLRQEIERGAQAPGNQ